MSPLKIKINFLSGNQSILITNIYNKKILFSKMKEKILSHIWAFIKQKIKITSLWQNIHYPIKELWPNKIKYKPKMTKKIF